LLKKITALLIVILFCSYITPTGAESGSEILYSGLVSGGGPEIITETHYWGFCKVWVETVVSKSYSNGFVRNNPDKSFYPGDGFGYIFVYGWAGDPSKCRNFSVCPISSKNISPGSSQPCELQKLNTLAKKASKNGGGGSSSGTAEISAEQNLSGHYISLQVNAERWGCHFPKKAPRSCGWDMISASGSYSPSVIKPAVGINLLQEHLNDIDGYKSGNLDHTYYLWDAINIVHNPIYKWKEERFGTLSVKITKQHDLTLETSFQCESARCSHTLVHPGFEPWPRQYEYGGGTTTYNATKEGDISRHVLIYKIELYNLGRPIHKSENKTEQLVVVYDPVYENYPYLVLKDEYWWSWGNRQGIALEYKGSMGGGPDDTAKIHQERRSKINSYSYFGFAFDPILQRSLNQTFLWDGAGIASLDQKCTDSKTDHTAFEAKSETAMFVKAGFGKIAFSWPIVKTMLEKRYLNATIQNTLQSEGFAGYDIKDLTEYTYQYPDVKFNNPVKILTYHSDGSRTELPVSVKLIPDASKNAQYTQDYTCSKVLHDTGKPELANIVVDDMYGKENEVSGTGYINMKTQLTSTWFAPFYYIIVNDTLDLPISEGYKALSPYHITITVGEKTRTINRVVNFLSPFVHVANLDSDNVLNITEDFGFIRINPDEKFGEITKVMINGKELDADCTTGCTSTIHSNQDLNVEVWNVWGGRAFSHLEKSEEIVLDDEINWDLVFVVIVVAVAGLLLWKFAGQAMEYFGFRRV
jgi:hypothetical protein